MTSVVGVGLDSTPTVIRLDPLLDTGVVTFDLDGAPVVAWALPGTTSALDANEITDGRDVGATGVFLATHHEQPLTFTHTSGGIVGTRLQPQLAIFRPSGGFVDTETGSRWDIFGTAVDGPLRGARLEAIEHVDTFWFAWAAFAPETVVLP